MNARMPPPDGALVGRSVPHESAHLHVSGRATYIDDLPESAGTLHADGSFGLSEKGPSITALARTSVAPRDRCIWDGGNLCKGVIGLAMLRWRRFAGLFARRQRLQLGLSDSNVTQVAELLKVGTTALVIDLCERGLLRDVPRLRRPLDALRAVIGDPELRACIRWGDEELTALQVQRRYWERWNATNQEAIAAYNARIESEGLPLAQYRSF